MSVMSEIFFGSAGGTPRAPGKTDLKAKSSHARSVQYRARKQAADSSVGRLLTRAVLYRWPNVTWPDLGGFCLFRFILAVPYYLLYCRIKLLVLDQTHGQQGFRQQPLQRVIPSGPSIQYASLNNQAVKQRYERH